MRTAQEIVEAVRERQLYARLSKAHEALAPYRREARRQQMEYLHSIWGQGEKGVDEVARESVVTETAKLMAELAEKMMQVPPGELWDASVVDLDEFTYEMPASLTTPPP